MVMEAIVVQHHTGTIITAVGRRRHRQSMVTVRLHRMDISMDHLHLPGITTGLHHLHSIIAVHHHHLRIATMEVRPHQSMATVMAPNGHLQLLILLMVRVMITVGNRTVTTVAEVTAEACQVGTIDSLYCISCTIDMLSLRFEERVICVAMPNHTVDISHSDQ